VRIDAQPGGQPDAPIHGFYLASVGAAQQIANALACAIGAVATVLVGGYFGLFTGAKPMPNGEPPYPVDFTLFVACISALLAGSAHFAVASQRLRSLELKASAFVGALAVLMAFGIAHLVARAIGNWSIVVVLAVLVLVPMAGVLIVAKFTGRQAT